MTKMSLHLQRRLPYAVLLFVLPLSFANAANATPLTFISGLFNNGTSPYTDGNRASAQAVFDLISSTQLRLVLTNTTNNPWQDAQNLGAFSFQLNTGTFLSATLSSITGDKISQTLLNTDLTPYITVGGASIVTTPWKPTSGTAMNEGAGYIEFGTIGKYTMTGSPVTVGGRPEFTGPQPCYDEKSGAVKNLNKDGSYQNVNCGSSREYGTSTQTTNDAPMIYQSATFVFTLSKPVPLNLQNCTTGSATTACIGNVQFGFGPDGPDGDDVTPGTLTPTTVAPEPASLSLLGIGLLALGILLPRFLF